MKFGLQHPSFSYNYSNYQDTLKELAVFAERTGFDSFWVMDHFHQISVVGKPYEPMFEGWTTISFLAAVTTKIRLGTLVTVVIYRHPSVLAKCVRHSLSINRGQISDARRSLADNTLYVE